MTSGLAYTKITVQLVPFIIIDRSRQSPFNKNKDDQSWKQLPFRARGHWRNCFSSIHHGPSSHPRRTWKGFSPYDQNPRCSQSQNHIHHPQPWSLQRYPCHLPRWSISNQPSRRIHRGNRWRRGKKSDEKHRLGRLVRRSTSSHLSISVCI